LPNSSESIPGTGTFGRCARTGTGDDGRAAEQRDEFAALHSITSLAVICMISGTARPSALAALRLITVSYLTGACTGRLAGFW
jgi:hypothetical protein